MQKGSGTGQEALLLDAFVPTLIRRRIARNPSPLLEPVAERFQAAVLLADLSGFSALAENFSRRGLRGAEDLKDLLNFFCGRLVDLADAHGGEVLKFPGDAALALWPAGDGDDSTAARCAAQCALAAQEVFKGVGSSDVRLHLRVGIGVGELWAAHVGGVAGRWELLVAGDPLTQAVGSMAAASTGDVAVSSSVWDRIAPHAHASGLSGGNLRLEAITSPAPVGCPARIALAPSADVLLRAYVPRSVQARLDAGQTHWLAEFRRVAVLFIKLESIDYAAGGALDQLQRATTAVQTAVNRYGGSINQLLVDDKGTVVACGWGLALHAHGDDEVRAARAALEVRRELQEAGLNGSFGLATGEVFTGLRGNRHRCEYAMIGDTVNIAARLMQAAGNGEILCDLASFEGARKRIEFEPLPPVKLKGHARTVEVFRPIQLSAGGPSEIVGRTDERRVLRARLEALVSGNRGGVVILEGDPGIGKSRMVADVIEQAVARGVRTMVASGDAIERSAPYHAWVGLFDNLLGLEGLTGREGAERRVIELLESQARLVPFAPLLNPVLRLNFRETEQSERVPPRGRGLLTRELLIHLFRYASGGRATLLVVEDAHWLDSASWALAEGIERELPEILLLIALRPISLEEQPGELVRLGKREGTLLLSLDALSPEETRALVCQRLRARVLSEPVARLIRSKAEGHPFFTEELAYALRDRGLIQIEHGICRLTPTAAGNASVELPNTVQVVVSSRIDQLNIPQQLTVKVASVFGRVFDLAALRAAYPIDVDVQDLRRQVEALVARDLVQVAASEPAPVYVFKHAITQEVAYSLLPFALRRQLHAAAAGWYERQHPSDLSPLYPLLAHHWSRAEVAERAIFYLDKAGEQALGRHANEEAIRFYSEALDIDQKSPDPPSSAAPIVLGRGRAVSARDARHIRWHRRLGDGSINLGRWIEGQRHFDRALTLVGYPLPASDRERLLGLAAQVAVQCARRLGPTLFNRPSNEAASLLREAVCAHERMGSISYHYERMVPVVYSIVAALNLAERLGPSSELALVYADVGNVLGLVPLRPLARVYQRMARETASRVNDPVVAARVSARAAVYRLGIGDWTACGDLENSMALADQIGDSYLWEASAAMRARAAHLRGEFELAARLGKEIRERANANGSVAHEIWGIDAEVWTWLYLGHHEASLDLAEAGLRLLENRVSSDRLAKLDFLGAIALVHLYRGELELAEQSAERMIEIMAKSPPPRYFAVLGLSAAAETCLAIWEAEATSSGASRAALRVWHLCTQIDEYSHINPPARARALLWRGCAEWLEDRHDRAQATWRRCLVESERFALPYEAARAHYEIGRRLESIDPERSRHLAMAEEGFRQLKADSDVKRVVAARQVSPSASPLV